MSFVRMFHRDIEVAVDDEVFEMGDEPPMAGSSSLMHLFDDSLTCCLDVLGISPNGTFDDRSQLCDGGGD